MNKTLHRPGAARRLAGGFTLIEVMVVVVIIGILAAVAYPSYTEQIAKGRRADAQTALLEAAQYAQRYYAARNTFKDATLPAAYQSVPKGSTSGSTHAVTLTVNDDNRSYTLKAAPTDSFPDAKCGALSLDDTGKKTSEYGSVANCWR